MGERCVVEFLRVSTKDQGVMGGWFESSEGGECWDG